MTPARIAELLEPFLAPATTQNPCHSESGQRPGEGSAGLSPGQLHHISTYIDLLLRWNARVNLTAIRDPEQIVTRHFGESLFAARRLFPQEARVATAAASHPAEQSSAAALAGEHNQQNREGQGLSRAEATLQRDRALASEATTVADVGSGAGFPGLPFKLWHPNIALTLIESNHKKAAFLREVTRALTLTDINIQTTRAETLHAASFDVVTLRAVESFETILPVAANLVAPSGRLALLIGSAQLGKAQSSLQQFTWSDPEPIPGSNSRILAVANRLA
jgi:16S rRNA (guanine527-N7)-methyltransferase